MAQSQFIHPELENYKLFVQSSIGDKLPQEPKEEVFDFYHTPLSQPSAAVKTILDISGAKYNTHIINLLQGQNRSEEYLKVNPLGVVPSLALNNHTMVESASILRFLADKFELNQLYPKDINLRYKIDCILDQSGTSLRTALSKAL